MIFLAKHMLSEYQSEQQTFLYVKNAWEDYLRILKALLLFKVSIIQLHHRMKEIKYMILLGDARDPKLVDRANPIILLDTLHILNGKYQCLYRTYLKEALSRSVMTRLSLQNRVNFRNEVKSLVSQSCLKYDLCVLWMLNKAEYLNHPVNLAFC